MPSSSRTASPASTASRSASSRLYAGEMRAGGKAHGADMAGDADRDFGGAHVGDRVARRLHPFAGQIVGFRHARPLDQDDHGEFVRRVIAAGKPGRLAGMRQMPVWAASRKVAAPLMSAVRRARSSGTGAGFGATGPSANLANSVAVVVGGARQRPVLRRRAVPGRPAAAGPPRGPSRRRRSAAFPAGTARGERAGFSSARE